jgi:hypothetical protein
MLPNSKRFIAALRERRAVRKGNNRVEIFESEKDAEEYVKSAKKFGFTESYVIDDYYSPKQNRT